MSKAGENNPEPPAAPNGDEALLALQKQLTELNQRVDEIAKRAAGGVPIERVARLERLASLYGAVICEMHTNTIKSDITALQKEARDLLAPIRASFDAPAEEASHVA